MDENKLLDFLIFGFELLGGSSIFSLVIQKILKEKEVKKEEKKKLCRGLREKLGVIYDRVEKYLDHTSHDHSAVTEDMNKIKKSVEDCFTYWFRKGNDWMRDEFEDDYFSPMRSRWQALYVSYQSERNRAGDSTASQTMLSIAIADPVYDFRDSLMKFIRKVEQCQKNL